MKASHYVNEVRKSQVFKDFIKDNPKAYLCSLFCSKDFIERKTEIQVDFYSPEKKTIISFKVGKKIELIPHKKSETILHKKFVPGELKDNIKMDVEELRPTLVDEMHNREMAYEIEKVLAFVNIVDGKPVWNCTGFLKGLGLLQAHVEDSSASVLFMEKKSLFDMIRFAGPAGQAMQNQLTGGLPGQPAQASQAQPLNAVPPAQGGIKFISPQEFAAELQKAKAAAKQAEKPTKTEKKKDKAK